MGEVCLQHVISDFKDDDTSRNPETIGRDPEKMEQEPAAQGEMYQYDEREGAGFLGDAPAFSGTHALGHLQENRHHSEGVHQCEQRSETQH